HRVVDGAVAVRVQLAHDLADDAGALDVPAVGAEPHLVHRVQDPALDGLQPVAGVGEGPLVDHRVGVLEEAAAHLLGDVDVDDVLLEVRRWRGLRSASCHAPHCGRSRRQLSPAPPREPPAGPIDVVPSPSRTWHIEVGRPNEDDVLHGPSSCRRSFHRRRLPTAEVPLSSLADFQNSIYLQGLGDVRPPLPTDLTRLEGLAEGSLSVQAFGYVAGSAGTAATARANREAFDRWRIVPRMLRDVSERDMSVEVLGTAMPSPVLLAPIGVQSILHPDGELATARAAAAEGVPMVLSTASSYSIEEVAEANGD